MAATVALAGLAARVNAPPFPGADADPEAIQDWIVDIMRRVGARMPTPNDIRFLRYVADDYQSPMSEIRRQLLDLCNRLEKGNP